MSVPTAEQAQIFFQDDLIMSTVTLGRLQYWIDDIEAKNIITDADFGSLYFNAFMSLLGHFLSMFELNSIPFSGGIITSETTAKLSRSFAAPQPGGPFYDWLNLTRYGRMYLWMLSQLAVTHGGFVAVGNTYV